MKNISSSIHPEILDGLDYEKQYILKSSGPQRRDVKLGRGDSWLVRYLPASIGPKGRFYARIAKHWASKKAIVCPRHTEDAFGGDPSAYCPVCELSEHLNADRNEEVSKFGYKIRGSAAWVTYCAVFQKAVNGGEAQDMPMTEVLQPYTHQHFKASWEELMNFIKVGTRRAPLSVLDFEKGNDFYVSMTAKGMRLDKQDSTPIFDLADPKFGDYTQQLLDACKDPIVKIPTDKQLEDFAAKAEEEADRLAPPSNVRSARTPTHSQRSLDEDDNEDDSEAVPAAHAPAPRRRPPVAAAEDDVDYGPPPSRGHRAETQDVDSAPRRSAAPAPRQTRAVTEDSQTVDEDQGPAEKVPVRSLGSAARPSARPSSAPPPPPARRTDSQAARAPVAQESLDADEDIPEESRDAAPPSPLVGDGDGDSEDPTPVAPTRRGAFAASMRSKIAAADSTARK